MVLIAGTVPVVLFALVGGALSDRLPRPRVMLSSDLVRSTAQFAMAALLLRSTPPLWALVAAQFCYGNGRRLFRSCRNGFATANRRRRRSSRRKRRSPTLGEHRVRRRPGDGGNRYSACRCTGRRCNRCRVLPGFRDFTLFLEGAERRRRAAKQLNTGSIESGLRRTSEAPMGADHCLLPCVLGVCIQRTYFRTRSVAALSRLGGASAWSLMLSAFGLGLISGSLVRHGC